MRFSIHLVTAISLLCSPATLSGVDAVVNSAGTSAAPAALKNVQLKPGGILHGQLVDSGGKPVVAAGLLVIFGDTSLQVTTDQLGRFATRHHRGGVCVLKVGEETFACRLWQPGTAPPSAIDSIAVVQSEPVVRGQQYCPDGNCPPQKRLHRLTPDQCRGLFLAALGGTALALALTQDAS